MKTILFIYGTRPEAIKMAPLVKEFQKHTDSFTVKVCLTGQHRQMLDQVNSFFAIKSCFDLSLMKPNQSLFDITTSCLNGLNSVLKAAEPDLVFVQGDTTTAMAGSLASFYLKIPVAHLEAGLRSGNNYSPFPEEINRKIAGQIASWHFAPTIGAAGNLKSEGISQHVYVVGNTVIDAMLLGLDLIKQDERPYVEFYNFIDTSKRIILVTGHRRESFGEPFDQICLAMRDIVSKFSDVEIVYPVHLNPNVQAPVKKILSNVPRVHLIPPVEYPYFLWLMDKSYFVLTDSGGIQEEAPALGKPVLVMRDVTERQEGIDAGTALLVGSDRSRIVNESQRLLKDPITYLRMSQAVNPYGDGTTSKKIYDILSGISDYTRLFG